jgi:hypothetical protein
MYAPTGVFSSFSWLFGFFNDRMIRQMTCGNQCSVEWNVFEVITARYLTPENHC